MHYICEACGGVSEVAKVCETEGCSRQSEPLTACDCADGAHHQQDHRADAPASDRSAE